MKTPGIDPTFQISILVHSFSNLVLWKYLISIENYCFLGLALSDSSLINQDEDLESTTGKVPPVIRVDLIWKSSVLAEMKQGVSMIRSKSGELGATIYIQSAYGEVEKHQNQRQLLHSLLKPKFSSITM
jgi:hypothetical protein